MDSLFVSSQCPNSELGDYVMMESCIDHGDVSDFCSSVVRPRRKEARREKRREFPPPLTMLAMTANQVPHMPFVMRRYHTDDGRLIIVEERVKHHDYFLVTRFEGRLVLDLVPGDDGGEERENVEEEEREIVEEEERECKAEEERENMAEIECEAVRLAMEKAVVMGGGKCYDYMRVRSNPCLFGMTVPTVRPVHI